MTYFRRQLLLIQTLELHRQNNIIFLQIFNFSFLSIYPFDFRLMVNNGSGLIVNIYPRCEIMREVNNLPRQMESLCSQELAATFSNELKKHNVFIVSLMVGPTNNNHFNEEFSGGMFLISYLPLPLILLMFLSIILISKI